MAIFDHTMQFKLLTSSQHYNYSRQRVCGITVNVFMVYLSKASTKIHYSLLITHYSLLITHYLLLITHFSLLGIQTPRLGRCSLVSTRFVTPPSFTVSEYTPNT